MEQGVLKVLGHNFCSSSRIPSSAAKPFSTLGVWFFEKVLYILFLGFDALWGNCSSEDIIFCCTEVTFVHCQLKACFLNAFERCSQVSYEVVSVIGCDADIVHILGTLIGFDGFVKVFPHKARKCGKSPAKALCQTSVCKWPTFQSIVGQPSAGSDMPVSSLIYRTVFCPLSVGRRRLRY